MQKQTPNLPDITVRNRTDDGFRTSAEQIGALTAQVVRGLEHPRFQKWLQYVKEVIILVAGDDQACLQVAFSQMNNGLRHGMKNVDDHSGTRHWRFDEVVFRPYYWARIIREALPDKPNYPREAHTLTNALLRCSVQEGRHLGPPPVLSGYNRALQSALVDGHCIQLWHPVHSQEELPPHTIEVMGVKRYQLMKWVLDPFGGAHEIFGKPDHAAEEAQLAQYDHWLSRGIAEKRRVMEEIGFVGLQQDRGEIDPAYAERKIKDLTERKESITSQLVRHVHEHHGA